MKCGRPIGSNVTYYLPDEFGCLGVTCWCGRKVVSVPVADIRRGQTVSCGRIGCDKENQ
jgi:hypothetical protein